MLSIDIPGFGRVRAHQRRLGPRGVIAVGNGNNDRRMLKTARID